jgi:triphosphoribosyl-dephospho-CoA synthase
VSLRRGLPGLSPVDFLHSASALRRGFSIAGTRSVGRLVLGTLQRTRRRVKTNTNLGLALILAPLAIASTRAQKPPGRVRRAPRAGKRTDRWGSVAALRKSLHGVLHRLTRRDAEQVYEAIRLANAGGLGEVDDQDVSRRPTRKLLACMILARRRDSIASEYASDYALTFGTGVPALKRSLREGLSMRQAIVMAYLKLLSVRPDTLVARKHGSRTARRVSSLAARVLESGGLGSATGRWQITTLDRTLRASHLNPGTTADLAAAATFVTLLAD